MKITKTRIIIYNLIVIFVVYWLPRILIALNNNDPVGSINYISYILTPTLTWTILAIVFGLFLYWIMKDSDLNQKQKLLYISLQILTYAIVFALYQMAHGLFFIYGLTHLQ